MDDLRDAVLAAQCLNWRLPTLATVRAEVTAWQDQRNDAGATVAWQFTTDAARTKLHRLYPRQDPQ